MSLVINNLKSAALIFGGSNLIGYTLTSVFETHKLTDLVGVGSFVLASLNLCHKNNNIKDAVIKLCNFQAINNYQIRLLFLNASIILWGTRLASYLFIRVLQVGEDKRLHKFFREPGEKYLDSNKSFFPIKLASFWLIQSAWGYVCMLPVIFANSVNPLTIVTKSSKYSLITLGLPLISIYTGILVETIADWQKSSYRSNKNNDNHWCDKGLYSLSRYPNYFGEVVTWWSIYFTCIPILSPIQSMIGLISPAFITFLLFKVSGIPLLEAKNKKLYKDNKNYSEYLQNTRLLIPFPKFNKTNKND